MVHGSGGPPAGAVVQTDATREAAVAQLGRMMDGGDADEPEPEPQPTDAPGAEALGGGDAVEAGSPDAGEGGPPDTAGDLDFAAELLTEGASAEAAPSAWEDGLKTKLVSAGLGERAAHVLAHQGGRENAEKVLANLTGTVSSKGADSTPGAEATVSEGPKLSADLLDQLDGQAKDELGSAFAAVQESARQDIAALREEVKLIRGATIKTEAANLAQRLVETRTEIQGAYPELNSPEEWNRLKPIITKMVSSGAVKDPTRAMQLAAIDLYGIRATTAPGSDNQPAAGTLLRGRNSAAGGHAATPETAKAALAKLIFHGGSTGSIAQASETYRKTL